MHTFISFDTGRKTLTPLNFDNNLILQLANLAMKEILAHTNDLESVFRSENSTEQSFSMFGDKRTEGKVEERKAVD